MKPLNKSGPSKPRRFWSDQGYAVISRGFKDLKPRRADVSRLLLALIGLFLTAGELRAEPLRLVIVGDSLSAGYNLAADASFGAQLQKRLKSDGFEVALTNASVSGDTTAMGLARFDYSIGEKPDLVMIELGANDMLRGIDPSLARAHLTEMLERLASRKIKAMLIGMKAGLNYGEEYKKSFDAIYPELSSRFDAPLYPFFLEGVAGDRTLVLADGLHPGPAGVAKMVDAITPLAERILTELRPRT